MGEWVSATSWRLFQAWLAGGLGGSCSYVCGICTSFRTYFFPPFFLGGLVYLAGWTLEKSFRKMGGEGREAVLRKDVARYR